MHGEGSRSNRTARRVLLLLYLLFSGRGALAASDAMDRAAAGRRQAASDASEKAKTSVRSICPSIPLARLGLTGANSFLPLVPGTRLIYQGRQVSLERTILPETAEVGGVDVRVVEDRERKSGNRVEVTRSLYAIDKVTGDVYSLGERVDNLRDGTLVSHQGSWQAGAGGASCGLAMPADPRVGDRYISEHAPAAALVERIEVVGRGETVVTPAGRFRNCLHLRETSSDEPSRGSDAWFAPGVGMVKDDEVELVRASVPPSS